MTQLKMSKSELIRVIAFGLLHLHLAVMHPQIGMLASTSCGPTRRDDLAFLLELAQYYDVAKIVSSRDRGRKDREAKS